MTQVENMNNFLQLELELEWIYKKKVNLLLFFTKPIFLNAPPSLSKTPTDMDKTKSNIIFPNLTIKQTYFVNTFIDFEN